MRFEHLTELLLLLFREFRRSSTAEVRTKTVNTVFVPPIRPPACGWLGSANAVGCFSHRITGVEILNEAKTPNKSCFFSFLRFVNRRV